MASTPRNPAHADAPLLVTAAKACELLACSDTTLRQLTAAGEVEVRYVGTVRRFVYASLVAYVERLPEDPAA